MMESPAGRFLDVRLQHIGLTRAGRRVLRDVSWRIRPGQRWVIAGENGAGKTQLLKLVAGSIWPTPNRAGSRRYLWRGEIWPTPHEVQQQIAYIGAERQDRYERYGWNHSLRQIIGTGLHHSDIPLQSLSVADHRRIERTMTGLGIGHLAARSFLSLSYGERRLALLARALAARPGLLLLDELLNGLDSANRMRALAWLEQSARSMLPWAFATHRFDDVPNSATHALLLERGRMVYRGPLARAPLARHLQERRPAIAPATQVRSSTPLRGLIAQLTRAWVYLGERAVLSDVSFTVRAGQCWVVHGANGSGKTTLLRTLYGDHGVAIGGSITRAGITPGVPLEIFRRSVGLVAAHLQAQLPQDLTVAALVLSEFGGAVLGLNEVPRRGARLAAARALARFGLSGIGERPLRELSYGQIRRALFARAWINAPRLLLLDEPFAGIDARTRESLQSAIQDLPMRGTAIVIATHHRADWPARISHELEIAAGRVCYSGPVRPR